MKKLVVLVLCSLGVTSVSYSQGHWRLGGNGLAPAVDAVNTTNNILGTNINVPLRFATNGVDRMHMNGTVTACPPYNRSGFIGFNNTAPMFHLDITTPEPDGNLTYGELMFRARTFDDTVAYISFVNLATTGTTSLPTLLANQSNVNT